MEDWYDARSTEGRGDSRQLPALRVRDPSPHERGSSGQQTVYRSASGISGRAVREGDGFGAALASRRSTLREHDGTSSTRRHEHRGWWTPGAPRHQGEVGLEILFRRRHHAPKRVNRKGAEGLHDLLPLRSFYFIFFRVLQAFLSLEFFCVFLPHPITSRDSCALFPPML